MNTFEYPEEVVNARVAERKRLEAENTALREALIQIVDEKCDYMRINNLGDPETQHTVKAARAALGILPPTSPPLGSSCVQER